MSSNERVDPRVVTDPRWIWGGTCAVLVVALLVQLPIHDRSIVPMDEGHLAAVATWILNGKALYRDLHTGIFPGIYHFTAGLLVVFGDDLIVPRWAEVVTNGVIAASLWLLGLRVMRPGYAAIAPLFHLSLVPLSFPVLTMFNYSSFSLLFSMLSLLFVVRLLDEGRRRDAIALGIVLALAVIAKQNFGALAFISCAIATIVFRRGSALEGRSIVATYLPIASAGLAVTLLVVGTFVATGTLMDLLHSTVIQLGGDQLESFNNPIPPIFGTHPDHDARFFFLYTPPSLFNSLVHGEKLLGHEITNPLRSVFIRLSYGVPLATLVAGAGLALMRARGPDRDERRRVGVPVLFALLFWLGIYPSAIWSHLAFVLPPVFLVMGLLLDRAESTFSRLGETAELSWQVVCGAAVSIAMAAGVQAASNVVRWNPVPLDIPRGSLMVSEGQARLYQSAVNFIEECSRPDEAIFVAPDMPVLYFLSDRMNATRYDLTIPGDVDGQLIMAGLEANQTRCIVYNPVMYAEFPPFQYLFPGVAYYLNRKYVEQQEFVGGFSTWKGLVRRTPASRKEGPGAPRE